jgi:hypothetical protein
MGAWIINRDVIVPGARRWVLFIAMLLLGVGYVVLYVFFVAHSENFIVAQRNRAAMQFGSTHPTVLPAVWTFGKGDTDDAHLGSGWAPVPIGGVQMVTQDAWIAFATTAPGNDVLLTLNTILFTTPAAPINRVEVSVNGQSLGFWQRGGLTAHAPIAVKVPHALVSNGQWLVQVHVDRIASLYRSDVGVGRNGQHLVLTTMTLRGLDDKAAVDSNGSATPVH